MGDEERHADGDRHRHDQCEGRADHGAERQGRDAEDLAAVRLPVELGEEVPLVGLQGRDRLDDEEDRDGRHDHEQEDARAGGGVAEGHFTSAAPRGGPAQGRSAVTGTNWVAIGC